VYLNYYVDYYYDSYYNERKYSYYRDYPRLPKQEAYYFLDYTADINDFSYWNKDDYCP
jgi:hypothetical protein